MNITKNEKKCGRFHLITISFLRILLHTSITGTMQFSEGFSELELDQQITLKGKFFFCRTANLSFILYSD